MKIHEYQAKSVLAGFGVPVPRGEVALSAGDVGDIARRLGGSVVVVKAQIHAGGRGKGGGVKLAKSPDEAEQIAKQILGMTLVTHQTGPEGRKVGRVLIEEGLQIERELYLSVVIDRATTCPVVIASVSGGMDIEEVAASEPEKILRETIDPGTGVVPFQARKLAFGMGLSAGPAQKLVEVLQSIYTAFIETDASMIEINPLILTKDGDLLALDAKVSLDDSALYRHTDLRELRDLSEEDPLEVEASKFSLNYIRLDGNIGCMVNGAGLAMATMDIIKLSGGEPANFLDVGGGANPEQIRNAFKILTSDQKRARRADQYFWRHSAVRRAGAGCHHGGERTWGSRAYRDSDGGHQRRRGQAIVEGKRIEFYDSRFDGRGRRARRGPRETGVGPKVTNGCLTRQKHQADCAGTHRT